MDRARDRFLNTNIFFNSSLEKVFRNQPRARFKTNNFKSLWIALEIDFWTRIFFLIQASKKKVFRNQPRARFKTNNFKSLWIALEIDCWTRIFFLIQASKKKVFRNQPRALFKTNNFFKSLDRARDWFLNTNIFFNSSLEKVFRNQPRARFKTNNFLSLWVALEIDFWTRIFFLIQAWKKFLETNPELYLKQIILKVFGSR